MDEKFTLTCMNQAMAQRMGGEYVCEDICSDGIIPNNDKLFNTNGETNKDYNYFLNLYNNKGPYSSPLKENLSPLLFNYMNSHQ